MSKPVIMWFRQDLRLADNAALCAAAAAGPVICLYIQDDETPGEWRWGGASRWWLHRSLEALGKSIKLTLRSGKADLILADVLKESGATAVYFARDYAPWSPNLEVKVKAACDMAGASCHRFGGFLLHEPEAIRTGAGEPYKVYTPFSRACLATGDPRLPRPVPKITPWDGKLASDKLADWHLLPANHNWAKGFESSWMPGEADARERLKDFIGNDLKGYADNRDRPDLSQTSHLSPHLHWGEISPVQCWTSVRAAMLHAAGTLDRDGEKYLKEVLWREFSYHLLYHWPHLPEKPFKSEYEAFPWSSESDQFRKWQRGDTGYSIVDAGMRELWATGYMHNRVRMIVASFLIKDLLVPWQDGERWFWDTLVDADIANNAASWQWVAGCGADAAPYFRIFNPVVQGEKFDPKGKYVRKWVPELEKLPDNVIHKPWEASAFDLAQAGITLGKTFPLRLVEHQAARDRALAALKSIKAGPS